MDGIPMIGKDVPLLGEQRLDPMEHGNLMDERPGSLPHECHCCVSIGRCESIGRRVTGLLYPCLALLFTGSPLLLSPGCVAGSSTIAIVDYRRSGDSRKYEESFDESFYSLDPSGRLDIVLRRARPGEADPRQVISQVVHLQSFWRSIPGQTVASTTQINATVSYLIMAGRDKTLLEGAGSLFFSENAITDRLEATLELAMLRPVGHADTPEPLFDRAELSGQITAVRDAHRVRRLLREVEQYRSQARRQQG